MKRRRSDHQKWMILLSSTAAIVLAISSSALPGAGMRVLKPANAAPVPHLPLRDCTTDPVPTAGNAATPHGEPVLEPPTLRSLGVY